MSANALGNVDFFVENMLLETTVFLAQRSQIEFLVTVDGISMGFWVFWFQRNIWITYFLNSGMLFAYFYKKSDLQCSLCTTQCVVTCALNREIYS